MCTCSAAKRRRRKAKIDKRYARQCSKRLSNVKWVMLASGHMKKIKL